MSKPVCNADWLLSHMIRGDYYCDLPIGIAGDAAAEVASRAEKVRENDVESMATLFHALLLSGFSMKIAGSSAPASGGEHLISHFWDMRAPEKGREPGLHGAQVGVATLMTARLYCLMRAGWRDLVENAVFEVERHGDVVRRFESLYGKLAGEVRAEYAKKFPSEAACLQDIETVKRLSGEIEKKIWPALLEPAEIRRVLEAAGAPVKVKALGLSREDGMEALLHGREIRGRYTVLDMGWELGALRRHQGEIIGEVNGRSSER
jgi:glycerol-1-phosphate dehydrogenase [NAD(P)+]